MANTNNTFSTPWFGFAMGLLGVIIGYGLAISVGTGSLPTGGGQVADTPPVADEPEAAEVTPVDKKTDHIYGNADAAISLVEYSDFECPYCTQMHPVLKEVVDNSGGKINWVYRHFPLSFHPNALPTAIASECIAEIGGNDSFWEFADMIYSASTNWDHEANAKALGLDVNKFTECINSGKYDEDIANEFNAGRAAGVSGTPGTIILNNKTGDTEYLGGVPRPPDQAAQVEGLVDKVR